MERNNKNGSANGSLNGNGSVNGSSIKRGAMVKCDGQPGVVENVIRIRFRGDIRNEYQVRLSDGTMAYFLEENFAPATTAPTLMERLTKIAWSCPRAQRGDAGTQSAASQRQSAKSRRGKDVIAAGKRNQTPQTSKTKRPPTKKKHVIFFVI